VAHDDGGVGPDDVVGQAEQRIEDVVGSAQRRRRASPTHPRQVGIHPPVTARSPKGRLEGGLRLAVFDTGTVQDQHRPSLAVLHVVPPYLEWHVGRASIVAFAQAFSDPDASGFRGELRGAPTQANRQPAVAWYLRPPLDPTYQALSLDVLRIEDGIVAEITGFVLPHLFAAFGLAPTLGTVPAWRL
jgi:hypothetical protein